VGTGVAVREVGRPAAHETPAAMAVAMLAVPTAEAVVRVVAAAATTGAVVVAATPGGVVVVLPVTRGAGFAARRGQPRRALGLEA